MFWTASGSVGVVTSLDDKAMTSMTIEQVFARSASPRQYRRRRIIHRLGLARPSRSAASCRSPRRWPGHGRGMASTGKSKTFVWRWQERFTAEDVRGLRRDRTRRAGSWHWLRSRPPTRRRSGRCAWSRRSALRPALIGIAWHDHSLALHRWRASSCSTTALTETLHDVVGPNVSPPVSGPPRSLAAPPSP